MNIHKIIDSPEAAKYLPFALSKLRQLERYPYCINQSYKIDGVEVKLVHNPLAGQQFLSLRGGGGVNPPCYEFFTAETLTGDGEMLSNGALSQCGSYTRVEFKDGAFKYTPIATSRLPLIGAAKLAVCGGADAPVRVAAYNNQKNPERINFFGAEGEFCVCTYTDSSAVHNWAGATGFCTTGIGGDVGPDLRPAAYLKNQPAFRRAPLCAMPRWWARATVRKVVHPEFGTRYFFIATDTFSRFYAYPIEQGADDITPEKGVSYTSQFKFADAPFPDSVKIPTVATQVAKPMQPTTTGWANGHYILSFNGTPEAPLPLHLFPYIPVESGFDPARPYQEFRYLWSFNSTATKAVAIACAEWEPPAPTPYLGIPHYPKGYPSNYIFDPANNPPIDSATMEPVKYRRPVLVEVAISLEVTGTGQDDFTFSVTLAQSKDSANTNDYYVSADYSFGDARTPHEKDELVVAHIEVQGLGFGAPFIDGIGWSLVEPLERSVGARGGFNYATEIVHYRAALKVGGLSIWLIDANRGGAGTQMARSSSFPNHEILIQNWGTELFTAVLPGEFDGDWLCATQVLGMDLRSLSMTLVGKGMVRDPSDNVYPYSPIWGDAWKGQYAFGEYTGDPIPGLKVSGNTIPAPPKIDPFRLPVSLNWSAVYASVLKTQFMTEYEIPGSNRSVIPMQDESLVLPHPDGHLALCMRTPAAFEVDAHRTDLGIDTIQFKDKHGRIHETTHQTAFNTAWQQQRGQNYYTLSGVGKEARFASAGAWSTIKIKGTTPYDKG